MPNKKDKKLLAMAKATQAKRMFNQSLKQLCLQVVARNEQLFVLNPGQATMIAKLPPLLKTDILKELCRQVNYKLRYPAGSHRLEFVKKLIHYRLDSFDFRVLHKQFNIKAVVEVWRCLVNIAWGSLLSVTDLACQIRNVECNLGFLLPFIAKLPKLEVLKINSWCCIKGQLRQLVDAAPKLKILHLNLHSSIKPCEEKSLFKLKYLEELDLFDSFPNFKLEPLMENLLKVMPQLKVNCIRTHESMDTEANSRPYHLHFKLKLRRPLNLEHISLAGNRVFVHSHQLFTKVQHVMVSDARRDNSGLRVCDFTKLFAQLSTLHIRHFSNRHMFMPSVQINGAVISTLVLEFLGEHSSSTDQLDMYQVLVWCPRLVSLSVIGFIETQKRTTVELPEPEELRLKKLHLSGVCVRGTCFLRWILRAPLLETLSFWATGWRRLALKKATSAIREGDIQLSNLHTFHFTLVEFDGFECNEASFLFVSSVLTLCPNLHTAHVDLDRINLNKSLKPILRVVNQ